MYFKKICKLKFSKLQPTRVTTSNMSGSADGARLLFQFFSVPQVHPLLHLFRHPTRVVSFFFNFCFEKKTALCNLRFIFRYEAYALYNFMALVLRFLQRNYDLRYVLEYKPRQMHIIPFCCLPPFPAGHRFDNLS